MCSDINHPNLEGWNYEYKGNVYTEYKLNKELTLCLVSGYNANLRMKIINRLSELESKQTPQIPQTYAEALQLAADQARQLEIAAPKVDFVDKYVESGGNKGFRQVAKLLGVKENVFRSYMVKNKIQYWLNDAWTAYETHFNAGRFESHPGTAENGHSFVDCKFTPKGVYWISNLLKKDKII